MPTYQYACTECSHSFEQFQNFSDDSLTVCPVCGGQLRKVFNAVGVVFKGSGFYRNDSRPSTSGSDGGPSSSSEKSGGEKPGSEKSGSEKSSGEKSSGEKSSAGKSGSTASGDGASSSTPKKKTSESSSSSSGRSTSS